MQSFSSDEEVIQKLQSHRVPCGPSLAPQEALTHPHFLERGTVRTVTDPLVGELQIPGFPFKSSDPFPDDNYTAAALGEHNFEVLNGLLGKSPANIKELTEKGILFSKEY